MQQNYLRAVMEPVAKGESVAPLTFVASTAGVKRDGLDLDQSAWYLDNYRANPVVLWGHDYMGQRLPIGKAAPYVKDDKLMADIEFDQNDEFARKVEGKYRDGYLHTVSVGWNMIERDGRQMYELLDISAVPVPGDPDALIQRQTSGLRSLVKSISRALDFAEEATPPPATEPAPSTPGTRDLPIDYEALSFALLERLAQTAPELELKPGDVLIGGEGGVRLWLSQDPQEARAGAVLSARNRDDLERAIGLIESVLERANPPRPAEAPAAPESRAEMSEPKPATDGDQGLDTLTRLQKILSI